MLNESQQIKKMILAQGGLSPRDAQFADFMLMGGFTQPMEHFSGRIELTKSFGIVSSPAHPTEDAAKTATDAVAC